MADDSLRNIYKFIQCMGLIDTIPDIKKVRINIAKFTVLYNICYEILDSPITNHKKINKLKRLGIFNRDQIEYIIKNQMKIIQPFQFIINKRKTPNKTINLQYGGENPSITIDGNTLGLLTDIQREKLIQNLKDYDISPQLESPIQMTTYPMPSLFEKITNFNFSPITDKLKSFGINLNPDHIRQMALNLGIPTNKDELLKRLQPYDKIGIIKLIENAKYMNLDKLTGPPIKLTDWIFFPLWSIENTPILGSVSGVPIDFLSVIVAQLDTFIGIWVNTLGNLKDPAIQAAMSILSVETAGIGLAVAPFIVPVINTIFDMVIHIVSHLGTILNMFIQISRKNFGLAYILFCEIFPIFETFMDTVINYMVLLNNFLNRSNRMVDTLNVLLDNSSKVIMMLNPDEFAKMKEQYLQKIKDKESGILSQGQNIQGKITGNIQSRITGNIPELGKKK